MEQSRISGNLTLNLSLPLLYTNLEQLACTRQDPAKQLTDHLATQLATNLTCHGALNTLLTGHLNSSLATEDRPVITEALQMVAAKFASELVDRFPDMLAEQIAITNGNMQRTAPVSAHYPSQICYLMISLKNHQNSRQRPQKTTPPIWAGLSKITWHSSTNQMIIWLKTLPKELQIKLELLLRSIVCSQKRLQVLLSLRCMILLFSAVNHLFAAF